MNKIEKLYLNAFYYINKIDKENTKYSYYYKIIEKLKILNIEDKYLTLLKYQEICKNLEDKNLLKYSCENSKENSNPYISEKGECYIEHPLKYYIKCSLEIIIKSLKINIKL